MKTVFRYLLGCLFIAAGVNHFWHTAFYVSIMPPYLPQPVALVLASGVAEVMLGVLLMRQRWQSLAGWGMVALCAAVLPVHVHMALNPSQFSQFSTTSLWLRLALQPVVMARAWWVSRPDLTPRTQPRPKG